MVSAKRFLLAALADVVAAATESSTQRIGYVRNAVGGQVGDHGGRRGAAPRGLASVRSCDRRCCLALREPNLVQLLPSEMLLSSLAAVVRSCFCAAFFGNAIIRSTEKQNPPDESTDIPRQSGM